MYIVGEHAKEDMMLQMLQNGILKMNHLLFDEFFKKKGDTLMLGAVEDHMLF
jgi:hypothetical protein